MQLQSLSFPSTFLSRKKVYQGLTDHQMVISGHGLSNFGLHQMSKNLSQLDLQFTVFLWDKIGEGFLSSVQAQLASESLKELIQSEVEVISESSYAVSGVLSSTNPVRTSRSENLHELLDGSQKHAIYKFDIRCNVSHTSRFR